MSSIYSFLQKMKMRESHNGFIMIIIAYLLSVLMLTLGSDMFYNINSAAADISEDTKEETKKDNSKPTPMLLQSQLIDPYGLTDTFKAGQDQSSSENMSTSGETIWLFGNAMDGDAFDTLMEKAESLYSAKEVTPKASINENKTEVKAEKKAENETKTVEAVSPYVFDVTKKEIKMLERIVEAEASGEDMKGKILIANVIFNRIEDEEFPDTVEDVIFQRTDGSYQFSPVSDERYYSVKISADTKEAVQRALKGEDYSKGALYFIARKRTKSSSAEWFDDNLKWLFKHGGHEFYKNK